MWRFWALFVGSFLVSKASGFFPDIRASRVSIAAITYMTATDAVTEVKVPGGVFVDEAAMLAATSFAIRPDDLVRLTKEGLRLGAGVDDPSILADSFEFCAPFVGPIDKEEYLGALGNFKLLDAFPDMDNHFHNIHVDPFEPNRVWWFTRATATHMGPLLGKPATGKRLVLPPQANSFTFNEEGKITQVTAGYVMDRRIGNTGGLGGVFGYFWGTGNPLPIPECQPHRKSLRFRMLGLIGKLVKPMKKPGENGVEGGMKEGDVGVIKIGEMPKLRFNLLTVGQVGLGKRTFIKALLRRYVGQRQLDSLKWTYDREEDDRDHDHDGGDGYGGDGSVPPLKLTSAGPLALPSEACTQSVDLTLFNALGYGDSTDSSSHIALVRALLVQRHMAWLKVRGQMLDGASRNAQDNRIHLCLYFIAPHQLKTMDLSFLSDCSGLVPIVPIVAKADSMTIPERNAFLQLIDAHVMSLGMDLGRMPIYQFERRSVPRVPVRQQGPPEKQDNIHNSAAAAAAAAAPASRSGSVDSAAWGSIDQTPCIQDIGEGGEGDGETEDEDDDDVILEISCDMEAATTVHSLRELGRTLSLGHSCTSAELMRAATAVTAAATAAVPLPLPVPLSAALPGAGGHSEPSTCGEVGPGTAIDVDLDGHLCDSNSTPVPVLNIFAVSGSSSSGGGCAYTRMYPWGTVVSTNSLHSDFTRLQHLLFEESCHMSCMLRLTQESTIQVDKHARGPLTWISRQLSSLGQFGGLVPAVLAGGIMLESYFIFSMIMKVVTQRQRHFP